MTYSEYLESGISLSNATLLLATTLKVSLGNRRSASACSSFDRMTGLPFSPGAPLTGARCFAFSYRCLRNSMTAAQDLNPAGSWPDSWKSSCMCIGCCSSSMEYLSKWLWLEYRKYRAIKYTYKTKKQTIIHQDHLKHIREISLRNMVKSKQSFTAPRRHHLSCFSQRKASIYELCCASI